MKYFTIILFIFSISCSKDIKKTSHLNVKKTRGYITLIFKNAPKARFVSLQEDEILGGRVYFEKLAYINDDNGIKQFIEPINRMFIDTITIPTNSEQIEVNFSQKRLIEKSFLFFNGDSIVVSYNQNHIPNVKILNRKTSKYDYLYDNRKIDSIKLSPEERYFKYLPYPSQKLSKIELQNFWHDEQKKSGKFLVENLRKEKSILDSLYNSNLLSKDIFEYYSNRVLYTYYSFLAKEKLLIDDVKHQNIEMIKNDIGSNISLNNASELDFNKIVNNENLGIEYSFYKDFFESYYIPKYYEEKTTKITNTYKDFGGTRYEYDLVYDSINQSDFFSREVKEYLLYTYMDKIAKELPIETVKSYYDKFKNDINNGSYIDLINGRYELDEFKTNKLTMIDYQGYEHYLEDIIDKNNGKIIYVNFWASWCKPCIDTFEDYESLIIDYRNDDVEFVNISLEKDVDAWKKNSKDYEFLSDTNNFLLKNYYSSKLIKDNFIHFIPRYLLFDSKGSLINNDAPKPDTKAIRDLIDSLN